jgi:8-oxo-dGTP pyrophosphatase MutT (NUDIX family)
MDVVCALMFYGNKFLLAERADGQGWEFPGGKVASRESHTHALLRELHEEFCLNLSDPIFHPIGQVRTHKICLHAYLLKLPPRCLWTPNEHRSVSWFHFEELSWMPLCRADQILLKEYGDSIMQLAQANRPSSEPG